MRGLESKGKMMRIRTQNRKGKKKLGQAWIDGFRFDFRMTDITNAFFALMGHKKNKKQIGRQK